MHEPGQLLIDVISRINLPRTTYDVDLFGGSPAPGTTVQLWGRWEPGPNQVWNFEKREFHSMNDS